MEKGRVVFALQMGVEGMTCASCSGAITRHLKGMSGVSTITVVLTTDSANIEYDAELVSAEQLCEAVEDIGFGATILSNEPIPPAGSSQGNGANTKVIMLVLEEGTEDSAAAAGVSDTTSWSDVLDVDALKAVLSQLPGVTAVKCSGRAVPAKVISDKGVENSEGEGAGEGAVVRGGSVPQEPEEVAPAGAGAGAGAVAVADLEAALGKAATSAASDSKKPTAFKKLTRSLRSGVVFAWSCLTGIDYVVSSDGPLCQVSVSINEDAAQGTGARLLLSKTNEFLTTQFPKDLFARGLPVSSSVVAQGAFLTASRMQAKHAREMRSLGSAVLAATVFTLPLFVIAMLMMDMEGGKALRMRLMMEIFPGFTDNDLLMFCLCTPVQIGSGWRFHRKAAASYKTREVGMDFLVSTGTFAAYLYSVASIIRGIARGKSLGMEGQYFETAAVLITVVLLGKYLEVYTRGMTASAINTLVKLRARTARIVEAAPKSLWPMPTFFVEANAEKKAKATSSSEIKKESSDSSNNASANKGDVLMDVSLLQRGDLIRLVTGESVPADCRVVNGHAGADESMLTGEIVMVGKKIGSIVFGGTTILEGSATALVECYGDDSALGRIVSTVQETQADKPPIQEVADAVSAKFVPAVAVISVISFATWSIAAAVGSVPEKWYVDDYDSPYLFAFLFALAVWVSACPCAFGLATPTALLVATGVAAKHGVLIRRGAAVQRAAEVNCVAFDKTGTLTLGKMTVTNFLTFNAAETDGEDAKTELMRLLYEAERRSSHPLAAAISAYCKGKVDEASGGLPAPPPTSAQTAYHLDVVAGQGVRMFANEAAADEFAAAEAASASSTSTGPKNLPAPLLVVGNPSFMALHGVDTSSATNDAKSLRSGGKVAILVSHNGKLSALLGVSDTVHPEASAVLACLRREGIAVYMVTGDEPATAYAIGAAVGIARDHILASAMPQDKEAFIDSLQVNHKCRAGFVGDGTNDANALARATVGIALGGGTDIAIDTGDILLVKNDLSALLIAFDISRRCFRRIKMNYFWAVIYNILLVPIAAGALYPSFQFALEPMLAGAAMAGSSVSIVVSSLLLNVYAVPKAYQAAAALARTANHDDDAGDNEPATSTTALVAADTTGGGHSFDECDCPASTTPVAMNEMTTFEKICSVLFGSCGYAAATAGGIGPTVGLVMLKAKNVSARATYDTAIPDALASDSGTSEFKACGCARSNCRCGADCRCGEKRMLAVGAFTHEKRDHANHKH